MEEQKRFKKQKLNSDNDKGMEQGAKRLRQGVGLAVIAGVALKNKDKIIAYGQKVTTFATKFLKK